MKFNREFVALIYSYFEKGCRKRCTRQSGKVLGVVLSSLFFKEICKNGTRGHGLMFAIAKGKQQKQVLQLKCQEQSIDHIPLIAACTFFRQPFSKELYMVKSIVNNFTMHDISQLFCLTKESCFTAKQ